MDPDRKAKIRDYLEAFGPAYGERGEIKIMKELLEDNDRLEKDLNDRKEAMERCNGDCESYIFWVIQHGTKW